jgi:hypothetical protein
LLSADHPPFLAAAAIVAGFLIIPLRQWRSALARFLAQLLGFTIVTGLLRSGGVFPYRPGVITGNETWRIFVGTLEVLWWFGAAWLATGFLRAFVVLGGKRESKLARPVGRADLSFRIFFDRFPCTRPSGERPIGPTTAES